MSKKPETAFEGWVQGITRNICTQYPDSPRSIITRGIGSVNIYPLQKFNIKDEFLVVRTETSLDEVTAYIWELIRSKVSGVSASLLTKEFWLEDKILRIEIMVISEGEHWEALNDPLADVCRIFSL